MSPAQFIQWGFPALAIAVALIGLGCMWLLMKYYTAKGQAHAAPHSHGNGGHIDVSNWPGGWPVNWTIALVPTAPPANDLFGWPYKQKQPAEKPKPDV